MDSLVGFIHSGVSIAVPFVILLGLLIFVHELGHFSVAKWCKVRVETFSLGFGKKILLYKKGDTVYCLSLIPLGGYVKMFGDEVGAVLTEEEKKISFNHKNVWQRIAIVLAGPMMNLLFAVFIYFVVAYTGEEILSSRVGDISNTSAAYTAGFRSGDQIFKIDNQKVSTWEQVSESILASQSKEITFEVKRDNTQQTDLIKIVPEMKPNKDILSTEHLVPEVEGLSPFSKASVVAVVHNSLAKKFGFKTGDRIKAINDRTIKTYRELENSLISYSNQDLKVDVERIVDLKEGKFSNETIQIRPMNIASLEGMGFENPELYLAQVLPDTPAEKSGLKAGDKITKINSVIPTKWEDILNSIKSYSGEGVLKIEVSREGENVSVEVQPRLTSQMNAQGGEDKRFTVGIVPMVPVASAPDLINFKAGSFSAALSRGVNKTYEATSKTLISFVRLFQNKISPKNIGGIISIGQAASETYKMGISYFLRMMGFLSINLFILNLLPIPVLDGGHLVFYVIEALKGSPVSLRKMEVAQQIGIVLLMSLMVFALFNDFSRLLSW